MRTIRRTISPLMLVAIGGGPAAAQSLVPSAQVPPTTLKRVDPGAGDVGPVSTSTRVMPLDLRINKGFEGVYSFQRTDPYGHSTTWFTRSDGGLTAVFPRSQYLEGPGGLFAEVPAGTTFIIGSLPESAPARPAAPKAFNAVDLSAVKEQPPPPAREPAVPRPYERPQPSIWTSDKLRQARLEELLGSLAH